MWIAVEEAVQVEGSDIEPVEEPRDLRALGSSRVSVEPLVVRLALVERRRQDPRRTEVSVHLRHDDSGMAREASPIRLLVVGFLPIVTLVQEALFELGHDRLRIGAEEEHPLEQPKDFGVLQVRGHRGVDTRVLNLHRHVAPIEGSRPVLVEIQALVAPSAYGTPRRAVVGWDSGRLAMVLAVLEARCGLGFGDRDVYLNVAGGLRVTEPAADLAAAAALASSALDVALPQDCVVFGEISLSGDVRQVSRMDGRLKEAAKFPIATGEH